MDLNKLTEAFPHESFDPVPKQPTFKDIHRLRQQVMTNAGSITTTLGGGQHGYIGMFMDNAEYTAISNGGEQFNIPEHPGEQGNAPAGLTAPQIANRNHTYDQRVKTFREYEAVANAIRKLMIKAIPSILINELSDDVHGFAQVQPSEILDYLVLNYGTPTQNDIEKNRDALNNKWNPDDGIHALWDHVRSVAQFADSAGEPITNAVKMRLTLKVLETSGVMDAPCADWIKKAEADKTWNNFRIHFNRAEKERLRKLTAAQAGYNPNNAANAATQPPPTDPNQCTPCVVTENNVKMYYCWTHGLGKNRNHTSPTCKNKADGHKDEATADNMMGGNNKIMSGRRPTTTPQE